jgi:oxidoreductase
MNSLDEDRHTATISTAIVGLGWVSRSVWLPRLRSHPRFAVTGLVDPDPAAFAAAIRGAGDASSTQAIAASALNELRPELIDLAIVAVPNYQHAATACELLSSGISVFVEKPVCLNTAEADQLAEAERAGGSVLLAGSATRHRTDVQTFLQQMSTIGPIRHVELAWVRARGVPGTGSWFTRRQLAGGGALTDLGWHLLDILALLIGPAGFTQVSGTISADFLRDPPAQADWRGAARDAQDTPGLARTDVEDTARAFLVTEHGVSVAMHVSWASHETADATVIRVDGSAGSLTLRCTFGFSPHRVNGSTVIRICDGNQTVVPVPEEPVGSEYSRQLDEIPALLTQPGHRGAAITRARWIAGVIESVYDRTNRPAPVVTGTGSKR